MDAQKQQVVAKLKEAKNVLVTVSADPSVDQLAACLGLTLMLNKLGKHATAVFSGQVPSTIEFLQPEDTLEPNTNSLRDFIIALDRNKADKLRYKVEDKVVRIFITPYKTSISQDDLQFSEGDFNVDVVVGLGVKQQQDIDQAVTAQGNILHDATVITMTTSDESSLGSIHWRDPEASGVSELAASISDSFDKNLLDEQIATAFLTGIVAQTERFSNTLTTSKTMTISAQLMSAGANQQLVATKLEEPAPPPEPEPVELPEPENPDDDDDSSDESNESPKDDEEKNNDGALEIDHSQTDEESPESPSDEQPSEPEVSDSDENASDEPSESDNSEDQQNSDNDDASSQDQSARKVLRGDGPKGGQLTANSQEEPLDPSTDPFSLPPLDQPMMEHNLPRNEDEAKPAEEPAPEEPQPEPEPEAEPQPEPEPEPPEPEQAPEPEPPTEPEVEIPKGPTKQTLDDIESSVHSPHHPQVSATPEPKPEASTFSAPMPAPQPEPVEDQLPSVSVDSNGLLIHHNGDEPELQTELKPAPGFGGGQSPMDMPSPNNLSMTPAPNFSDNEPDNRNPPPVPPPMTPRAS